MLIQSLTIHPYRQEKVKTDLDWDVQLGVIEPIPVGELVTWCHRMVVCAKKKTVHSDAQ